MKAGLLLGIFVLAVITGCGGSSKGTELYSGRVTVLLTDNVDAAAGLQRKNQFSQTVPAIDAYLSIANSHEGQRVVGRWYQLGTLKPEVGADQQIGVEITANNYKVVKDDIDIQTRAGTVRLRLVPSAPLPVDSYMLRVFVDDKLAKTVAFVVAGTSTGTPQPTPAPGR